MVKKRARSEPGARGQSPVASSRRRERTERRETERAGEKLAEARMKLAKLEPGGSREHPIVVQSASVIEVHALGLPCLACGAQGVRLDEHAASEGLRLLRLRCPRCDHTRALTFRIAMPS